MEYPDSVIRIYEEYLMAQAKERDGIISKLVKGSTHYNILKCIDIINSASPSQEDKDFIQEITDQFDKDAITTNNGVKELTSIWIKYQLGKYVAATDNDAKITIMKEILSKICNININDYKKPLQAGLPQGSDDAKIACKIDDSQYSEEVIKKLIETDKEAKNSLSSVC